jgi:hypothetical protein
MVEIKNKIDDSEWKAKIKKTRELCNLYFPNYNRVKENPIEDYWDCFKKNEDLMMNIHYTKYNMVVFDKKINKKDLETFGKEYEKIWDVKNFEIIIN